MTTLEKNLMIRVIKRKLAQGESFDEIIARYPKLTKDEVAELKEAVGA